MNQDQINRLISRIGKDHLSKRLYRQVDLSAKFYAKGGYSSYHLENIKTITLLIKLILKGVGFYNQGVRNTVKFRISKTKNTFKNLPKEFNGFKILHLSDLHSDGFEDNAKILINLLKEIDVDISVITGDFRFLDEHVHSNALRITQKIVNSINSKFGIYGVLGNHDFIEFVPDLEKCGIQLLLNESVQLKKDNKSIFIAGIDDPHFYNCHDIERSLSNIPENEFIIFLSHSPETYADVALNRVDYFLCGHTHGGQICLPGGISLFKNAKCPRKLNAGLWSYKNICGYTSRGTGSSGLPVRFNCPPEITVHTLLTAD